MHMELVPCAGCGIAKVLKTGDYCIACALKWEPRTPDYIIIGPGTIDEAADSSGIAKAYLKAKSDEAFENYQSYVIYPVKDEWREITISDRLHVPTVMKHLLEKIR